MLTVYALTAVLTAVPVIGAVLRSEATPSLKWANSPATAAASTSTVPLLWPPSRPSSTSASASSTMNALPKLSIAWTRSDTAAA